MQNVLGKDKVDYAGDTFMTEIGADGNIDWATFSAADNADAVVVFLGTSTINPHIVQTVRPSSFCLMYCVFAF